jgi:hypothetical protein
VVPELRRRFNEAYTPERYALLLRLVNERCGVPVEYRIAESPVFLSIDLLDEMASEGAKLTGALVADAGYLAAARRAIPAGFDVAGQTAHPNFLTADFALIRDAERGLAPRLVEIQAFPSVYGYQDVLCSAYRDAFGLQPELGCFLGGLDEASYWKLMGQTVLGGHDPKNVVLTELDPRNQKTLPDFEVTARRLGIKVVDIRAVEAQGKKLHYRDANGTLVPIHRIYNRAIADELIARQVQLPFDLTREWDVEWAGHPNWYFLISKFSIPWLSGPRLSGTWLSGPELPASKLAGETGLSAPAGYPVVPAAVFLNDFLEGNGRAELVAAGVSLPAETGAGTVYSELLLKPLFSFAGKGIQFDPTQTQLEAIPADLRKDFLLQQRMRFERTIETPHGLTQAEIRILYLWPDGGNLTPALSLVRLGRGKMMGVDHNKNQQWVGASAAFFPPD